MQWLNLSAGLVGIAAAALWFLSAPVPPPATQPGSHFELFDPEEKRKLAKPSRWAAILTGAAALLSAIAALLSWGARLAGL